MTAASTRSKLLVEGLIRPDAGACEIIVEAVPADLVAPTAAIERALELFESAVRIGMFSRVALIDRPPSGQGRSAPLGRHWRVEGLPPSALRILLDMLECIHQHVLPLTCLRIDSVPPVDDMLRSATLVELDYPRCDKALPFELRILQDVEVAQEPVIRLACDRTLSDNDFDTLRRLFDVWDAVLVNGGYGCPFGGGDAAMSLTPLSTYMAAPSTVEHLLYWTVDSARAFDAIVNAIHRFHATVCTVSFVEIE